MNANLMRSARAESAFHERVAFKLFQHLDDRDSPLAIRRDAGTSPTIAAIADQLRVDATVRGRATHESLIAAFDCVLAELFGQTFRRLFSTRKEHYARSVAVKAVNSNHLLVRRP